MSGPVATEQPSEPRSSTRRWRPRLPFWRAAGVVVALGFLALAAERGLTWRDLEHRGDDRRAATGAASDEVVGLISISGDTSDRAFEALLDGATASFRDELKSQAERLQSELSANDVRATGEVVSAAVTKIDDDSATVIVAARGTVQNAQTPEPEPRNYRLEVELDRVGDRWLVSKLEFVA